MKLKALLILMLALICSTLLAIAPWDEPEILTGSMTVMAEVTIDGLPASANDVLAAFVTVNGEEELRGKQDISVIEDTAGCLILIYTDTDDEEITFKVWDDDAQEVVPAYPSIFSEVNGMIGSWPDELFLIYAGNNLQTVADPVFDPPAGTYHMEQDIMINCSTPGAQIYYTLNGSDPTEASILYTKPIHLPPQTHTTIKARAYLSGWLPSPISTAIYEIIGVVEAPYFTPAAGTYATEQNIVLNSFTPGSQILTTSDGSEPTEASTLNTNPIHLPLNSTTTIKAKGFKTGWLPSPTASAEYIITGTLPAPTFDPPAGSYKEMVEISLNSSISDAAIHYTINGSIPNSSSPLYSAPITNTQDTTIKAIAAKDGWISSTIATATYQILPVAIPDDTQSPAFTGIHGVYPNPFRDAVSIQIGIKEPANQYLLNIYNLKGQCVHEYQGNGKGFVEYNWDGCDASGKPLPAGIYILQLKTPTTSSIKKIVKQKSALLNH